MNKVKLFAELSGLDSSHIPAQRMVFAEEVHETLVAWARNDKKEMLDGLADCDFVNKLGEVIGEDTHAWARQLIIIREMRTLLEVDFYSFDEAFDRVCESNLTKFDTNQEDALKTSHYYQALQVKTTMSRIGDYYVTKVSEDCTDINGKFYPSGKVLKSVVNYNPPVLDDLVELM